MSDVLDIAEQLQKMINTTTDGGVIVTGMKAAEEISRLRAENDKLRAELEAIKSPPDYGTQKIMNEQINYAGLIAQKDRVIERQAETIEKLRAALKPFADILEKHGGFEKLPIDIAILYAAAAALKETGDE